MEMTHDWRSFRSMFYPKKRAHSQQGAEVVSPIYVVAEDGVILTVFSEFDDLTEWIGRSLEAICEELSHREIVWFEWKEVDSLVKDSLSLSHVFEQTEFLRREGKAHLVLRTHSKKGSKTAARSTKALAGLEGTEFTQHRHFLLEALLGWWSRVMPSAYGVFVRVGGQEALLIFRRGRLDSFQAPDLSAIGFERARKPTDVVKYLSEKYLVPVQGLFVSSEDWTKWSESTHPWREIVNSVRSENAKLVPFRWNLAVLALARAWLGV